jgi:hypothetical protein
MAVRAGATRELRPRQARCLPAGFGRGNGTAVRASGQRPARTENRAGMFLRMRKLRSVSATDPDSTSTWQVVSGIPACICRGETTLSVETRWGAGRDSVFQSWNVSRNEALADIHPCRPQSSAAGRTARFTAKKGLPPPNDPGIANVQSRNVPCFQRQRIRGLRHAPGFGRRIPTAGPGSCSGFSAGGLEPSADRASASGLSIRCPLSEPSIRRGVGAYAEG